MIVAFVLDPSALKIDAEGADLAQTSALHRTVIDLWRRSGVLLCDLDAADSDLAQAVQDLPQSLRTHWKLALRHQKVLAPPAEWRGLAPLCDQEQLKPLVGSADVILVEPTRASRLGVVAGEASCQCANGIEVTRFDCASESERFRQARDIREEEIEPRTKTSAVWKNRFQRLARISRNVVAVDRYAVDNLSKYGDRSGMVGLAKQLRRDGCGVKLSVYASICDGDVPELKGALSSALALSGKGIREIEVFLLKDDVFRRLAHGRYVRFDNFVCEIDTGLEILAGDKVFRQAQFTMKSSGPKRRLEEQTLRSHAIDRTSSAAEVLP